MNARMLLFVPQRGRGRAWCDGLARRDGHNVQRFNTGMTGRADRVPEGRLNGRRDADPFGRPFGTRILSGLVPGVEIEPPGYSEDVPPGRILAGFPKAIRSRRSLPAQPATINSVFEIRPSFGFRAFGFWFAENIVKPSISKKGESHAIHQTPTVKARSRLGSTQRLYCESRVALCRWAAGSKTKLEIQRRANRSDRSVLLPWLAGHC